MMLDSRRLRFGLGLGGGVAALGVSIGEGFLAARRAICRTLAGKSSSHLVDGDVTVSASLTSTERSAVEIGIQNSPGNDGDDSGFGMQYHKYEYDPLVPPRVPTPFGIGDGIGIGMFNAEMIREQSEKYLGLFHGTDKERGDGLISGCMHSLLGDRRPFPTLGIGSFEDTDCPVSMTSAESESDSESEDTESIVMVPSVRATRMRAHRNKNNSFKHTSHHYHHYHRHLASKRRPPLPLTKISYSVVDGSDSDIGCMGSGHASVAERLERALDSRLRAGEGRRGAGERAVCVWDLKDEVMVMPSFSSVVLGVVGRVGDHDFEERKSTIRPRTLSMDYSSCVKPIGYYGRRGGGGVEGLGGKREDSEVGPYGRRATASVSRRMRMKMNVAGGGKSRKKKVLGRFARLVCPKPSLTAFV